LQNGIPAGERYNGYDVAANTATVVSDTYVKLLHVADSPYMIGTSFVYERQEHEKTARERFAAFGHWSNAWVCGLYPFTSKGLSRCTGKPHSLRQRCFSGKRSGIFAKVQ